MSRFGTDGKNEINGACRRLLNWGDESSVYVCIYVLPGFYQKRKKKKDTSVCIVVGFKFLHERVGMCTYVPT